MPKRGRWRLVRRGAAVLGVALILAEIVLQLAARGTPARQGTAVVPPGAVTILVVGDSHAAGGGATPDTSLPAHLERILAARHPDTTIRVVNAGMSGANSAWVANRLERNVERYDPALIIVWVGLNDFWNLTETEAWPADGWHVAVRRMLSHSRLYRLVTVIWHTGAWEADSGEMLQRQAGMRRGSLPPQDLRRGLAFDLERMARLAFTRRIPMILMQYPLPYPHVNRTIRDTAIRLGIPLVETARDITRTQNDGHDRAAILNFAAGAHPTGLLYRYIAESTLPEVEKALRAKGVRLAAGR